MSTLQKFKQSQIEELKEHQSRLKKYLNADGEDFNQWQANILVVIGQSIFHIMNMIIQNEEEK